MKREFRVLKHQEFDRIIHGGLKKKSPNFTLYIEKGGEHARIGIAVSKNNGNAVTRVRIKRQVRAMIASGYDLQQPLNLIIVVRPSYDTLAYSSQREELLSLLSQAEGTQH